jgi:uncharacterized C2H2 Zn-finger protein
VTGKILLQIKQHEAEEIRALRASPTLADFAASVHWDALIQGGLTGMNFPLTEAEAKRYALLLQEAAEQQDLQAAADMLAHEQRQAGRAADSSEHVAPTSAAPSGAGSNWQAAVAAAAAAAAGSEWQAAAAADAALGSGSDWQTAGAMAFAALAGGSDWQTAAAAAAAAGGDWQAAAGAAGASSTWTPAAAAAAAAAAGGGGAAAGGEQQDLGRRRRTHKGAHALLGTASTKAQYRDHRCSQCGHVKKDRQELGKHVGKSHWSAGKRCPYECSKCKKSMRDHPVICKHE